MENNWRVFCALPNASTLISGIAFSRTRQGMLSEPIAEGVAKNFAKIPGYELVRRDASGRLLVGIAARTGRRRAGGILWSADVFAPRD